MKKFLAILLAALMIFTVAPSLAMAEENDNSVTVNTDLTTEADQAELDEDGNVTTEAELDKAGDDITEEEQAKLDEAFEKWRNEQTSVFIGTADGGAYITKCQRVYARKAVGMNADGSLQLGAWECVLNETTGDHTIILSGDYVEFGFEFDITWGTNWPYSDVFWTVADGPLHIAVIMWGGTCRMASIKIVMNGDAKSIVETNLDSHEQYNWGCNSADVAHDYSEWETIKEPTALETGSKIKVCSICGDKQIKTIKKLTPTIKLSKTKKTIKVKNSYTLKISNLAKGDSVTSVVSSNKKIAKVKKLKKNQYKITGVKKGKATVTVTLKSGKTKKMKVTVK